MTGKLLTQRDVARQLGVAPARVRIYTAEGLLEYIQLPDLNKPRYTQAQVDTFLERMTRCHANENHAPAESLSFPLTSTGAKDQKTYTEASKSAASENTLVSEQPTSVRRQGSSRKRLKKSGTIL